MLFTDIFFLFYFLPIALLLHWFAVRPALKQHRYGDLARITIFLLSIIFYGFHSPWWLIPFFISIGFDFIWASLLDRTQNESLRKLWVTLSVTQNLALLALFKYWDFIGENLKIIFPHSNIELPRMNLDHLARVGLPAGISFYTFESLSFVVDVYRREVKPPKNPLRFFAFIGMFPRFVAGPIVRYKDMTEQFSNYRGMQIQRGLWVFAVGLFLKVCLADSCEVFTQYAFGGSGPLDFVSAWFGVFAYTLQIYLDFSGYSLMAIGLGICFGFEFVPNFNRPYFATSIADFWRRWHMSLSSWLRDYLYIPLGGNRHGTTRNYVNLFLTMLIGGIWHGASWLFVIWGAWHGLWLCIEKRFPFHKRWPRLAQQAFLMFQVMIGWIFFRSASLKESGRIITGLFAFSPAIAFNSSGLRTYPMSFGFFLFSIVYCFMIENKLPWPLWKNVEVVSVRRAMFATALIVISILVATGSIKPIPFLYFQF